MLPFSTESIAEAGIVGAGGAGFPTHVKLSARAEAVVVNAAECEPLLHKDKELILHHAGAVVAGLHTAMRLCGAGCGFVGIKRKYRNVTDALRPLLESGMEIALLDDAYPSGDEITLIYETLGRIVAPGAIPISVGAVVLNVETLYNIARAAASGGSDGANGCVPGVVDKFVSVAGDIARPCTLRVPLGTPLSVCLEAAGGTTISDPVLVVGGAMMGYLEPDDSKPVTKTTGGIIVLPRDHFIVQRKSWSLDRTMRVGRAACDQCSFCTELCPRYLLGHPVEPHRAMRSLGFNLSRRSDTPGTAFCCECNLCSYYSCPEGLDPKNVCAENKRRILAKEKPRESPAFIPERARTHQPNRKTPTARLIRKIGLAGYPDKAPLDDRRIAVREVAIPLKQHIGAPCLATVRPGERVRRGERIAVRPIVDGRAALGADIHASIDGTVTEIDDAVRIRAD